MTSGRERIVTGNSQTGILYRQSAGGAYRGTRITVDGKTDSRIFKGLDSPKAAITVWREWQDAEVAKERRAMQKKAGRADEPGASLRIVEESEEEVATQKDSRSGEVYALVVVGGAPLYWFESYDKAMAVQDALTHAAKASGFAAKYDVCEVKRWAE